MKTIDAINKLGAVLQKNKESNHTINEWNLNYFSHHKRKIVADIQLFNSKNHYSSGKILEIGSAPYHLTFILKELGYEVVGMDIAPERFSTFVSNTNLNILKLDIEKEKFPIEDNAFKLIYFSEVFEHLRIDPIGTLKEINRVLAPEGVMILTTPNLYSFENIVKFMLGRGYDNPYKEFNKLHTIGHMGHVRLYSVNQMKTFLINCGFEIVEVKLKSFTPIDRPIRVLTNFVYLTLPPLRKIQMLVAKKSMH